MKHKIMECSSDISLVCLKTKKCVFISKVYLFCSRLRDSYLPSLII